MKAASKPAAKLRRDPRNARRPRRPTRAEKEARVSTVITMLLSGARRIEICEFARKQWGVTEHHADRYIADATGWIRANAAKSREEHIAEHLGRMDAVYRSSYAAADYGNAIKAAQDRAKLLGLYPTEKMRLDVYDWRDEARKAGVNPDEALNELERIISAEMEKRNDGGGDSEHQSANGANVDAAPIADTAAG